VEREDTNEERRWMGTIAEGKAVERKTVEGMMVEEDGDRGERRWRGKTMEGEDGGGEDGGGGTIALRGEGGGLRWWRGDMEK